MYRLHSHCRACGYATGAPLDYIKFENSTKESLVPVFDLGIQPLANDFRKPTDEYSGYAPLKVLLCPRCQLAQLSVVVDPKILYRQYSYVTSPSETMRVHFEHIADDMRAETRAKSVIEIGSNDGLLLEYLKERWKISEVLGIDPAENLCREAEKRGIQSVAQLFGHATAASLHRNADLIIARHVFCHCDDWQDFMRGIQALCHKDTLVCIETPYGGDTLERCEWDQVYHEHLSFLSLQSIVALLAGTELHLHRIERYPIHGGSVMLMLRHKDCGIRPHESVAEFLREEEVGSEAWAQFAQRAIYLQTTLKATVRKLRAAGKTVAALGASAKSTVWVNACGFTKNDIAFIADATHFKWFTTSPGSNIPIVDEGAILRELPDYVILFCWNFAIECIEKNQAYLNHGGSFIIPIPDMRIVSKEGEQLTSQRKLATVGGKE